MIRFRGDILALMLLIAGISLFHARGLQPGQTFLPVDLANNNLPWRTGSLQPLQNWLISDPLYEFYPFLVQKINTIRQGGGWPLWNPYIFLGQPIVADPLAQPFYPVFVALGLVFGAARGLAIGLWLHTVLAAVLTYGFLRTLECRRQGAVLGAFTYALSGYMVTWFEAVHRISTLAWLPGILWAFELAVRRRSLRYAALSAFMMALAILGGQVTFALTFSLFLGVYALGRTVERVRLGARVYAWPILVWAVTVALAALLSAVQIVPFAEFLGLSHRAAFAGLADVLPWRQLVSLIVPDFYGNPTTGPYWGALNFSEATIYAGLVSLLLACLAPFSTRRFFVRYVGLVTIAAVLLITGVVGAQMLGSWPVFRYVALFRSAFILPLLIAMLAAMAMSAPRVPVRVAVVIACVLAALVGLAVTLNWGQAQDHWQQLHAPIAKMTGVLVAAVALLYVRARNPQIRRWADWSLVGLAYLDLYLFGSQFNPVGPISALMPPTPVVEFLRERVGLQRIVADQVDEQVLFGPNILSTYELAEPGGYSSVMPDRLRQLVDADNGEIDVGWMNGNKNIIAFSRPSRQLLDLLQVAYVVSPTPLTNPQVRAVLVADGCEGDSGEIAGSRTVSGTFAVRDTAINRLDVQFRVYKPGGGRGTLAIRMWRGAGREQLMLEARQEAGELKDEQTATFYFEPERQAPGQSYAWEIDAADAASGTGVGVCTISGGRPAVSVYGADWSQAYQGEVYVYERLAPLPRAYVVYAAERIADDAQAISRLLDKSFDVRNVAVVADPVNLPSNTDRSASPASIVTYQDTRVVIRVNPVQPGLLVVGDQFHPGWRASLDGQPALTIRVNHVLRGVVVPAGEHQVVFEFAPASLWIGGALSLAGLALLAMLAILEPAMTLRARRGSCPRHF